MTYISHNYNETFELGTRLGRKLEGGEFIAFYGDLGAGKTCFISGIAAGLGSDDPVSSPTFNIVHLYRGRINLAHFDMYRINEDMLEDTGFYDYCEDGSVVACEWCENIEKCIPDNRIKINIEYGENENDRIIEIEGTEL